ncbi:MAG: DNA translocase FtsK [Acidobacteriota bacterium]|nr:DNA translocase FtsK [Acidobacteriota bacterium]
MEVQTPEKPPRNSPWNEVMGLILISTGFVFVLALISYHADDPSWTSTGAYRRAKNLAGPIGANIASFIYQALGIAGWLLPGVLFVMGWWQWKDIRKDTSKAELVGVFLLIIALTGFLTLIPWEPNSFRLGGFIGYWLVKDSTIGISRYIGIGGAFVALVLLLITGLLLATPLSVTALLNTLSNEYPDEGLPKALIQWVQGKWRERYVEKTERFHKDKVSESAIQRTTNTGKLPTGPLAAPVIVTNGNEEPTTKPGRKPPSPNRRQRTGLPVEQNDEITGYGSVEIEGSTGFDEETQAASGSLRSSRRATASLKTSTGNGTTRRSAKSELDDEFDNEDSTDEFDDLAPGAVRTVEDMVSTASVKRANESEDKSSVKPTSKLGEAVTKIARMMADYKLPTTDMLTAPAARPEMAETDLLERARQLAEKCQEFNVSGQVKQISPGPVVTTFEFKPDPGVKYSRITSLVDDLCLGLKAESIRIDRIPGKSTVGIEVPNDKREVIRLREVIESKKFRDSESKLSLALGKTIDGANYSADLAKMPHLLIAGATGAGKSVALNSILLSLLYKATPDEVKLILVDPKRLELGLYADLPHLLTPIVTDPKRAGYALKWAVTEMENRYKHLAQFSVRNIEQYNQEVSNMKPKGDEEEMPQPLPFIVIIIDELADLMMVAAREVEESITRLAQMARAVGIHLVLATQRPSVDVITGLIKANFPSRISFRVSSKVDSRTIIDTNGAEGLLGQGDMLFLGPGTSRLVRVHGAYVDEKECKRICDFIRSQANPAYNESVVLSEKEAGGGDGGDFPKDEKYDDAVRIVVKSQKASTSLLQRHLRIGYGRAASIIDAMEREGVVGPEDGTKPRQVLVKSDFVERLDQMREEPPF